MAERKAAIAESNGDNGKVKWPSSIANAAALSRIFSRLVSVAFLVVLLSSLGRGSYDSSYPSHLVVAVAAIADASSAPRPTAATAAAEDASNPATTAKTPKLKVTPASASTHSSNRNNIQYDPASRARSGPLRRTSSTAYDDGGDVNAPLTNNKRTRQPEPRSTAWGGDNLPWYYPVWESDGGYCKNDPPHPDYYTALGDNPTLFQTAEECCEKWYAHILHSSLYCVYSCL